MSARESRPTRADEAAPEAFGGAEDQSNSGILTADEVIVAAAVDVAEMRPEASLAELAVDCTHHMETRFAQANEDRREAKRARLTPVTTLQPVQAAILLTQTHAVRVVVPGGTRAADGMGLLAIYREDGPLAGTYGVATDEVLADIAGQMRPAGDGRWVAEFERQVRRLAPRTQELVDKDLVPMANCWYDYATGERHPFSPDRVTLAKFATALPEQAPAVPKIKQEHDGTFWNAEEWFETTYAGIAPLLYQIIGMCLRPAHDWRKMVYLTGKKGLNGKGTVIELIRHIVGEELTLTVPPSSFSQRFALGQAIGKRVNLVDEDDVGTFIEKAAVLKQVISRDPITIDRKNRDPISVRLMLVMIVSLNEEGQKFKDKTQAMDDRMVYVPFVSRFKIKNNKDIKNDYVKRPEVCEWFAWKVLVDLPKYWSLEETEAAAEAREQARIAMDPVVEFVHEVMPTLQRDFQPWGLLYALFRVWYQEKNPSGLPGAQKTFTERVKDTIDPAEWVPAVNAQGKDVQLALGQWLTGPEPGLEPYAPYDHQEEVRRWGWQVKQWELTEFMRKRGRDRGLVRTSAWQRYQSSGETPSGREAGGAAVEPVDPPVVSLPRGLAYAQAAAATTPWAGLDSTTTPDNTERTL